MTETTLALAPEIRGIQNGWTLSELVKTRLLYLSLRCNLNCSYTTKYTMVAGMARINVGLKPLHSEVTPSVLVILMKASYVEENKSNELLNYLQLAFTTFFIYYQL